MILPPSELVGVLLKMRANEAFVHAAFAASDSRIETLDPIRVYASVVEFFIVINGFEIRKHRSEFQPVRTAVSPNGCGPCNGSENGCMSFLFVAIHKRQRATSFATFPHRHDDLYFVPLPWASHGFCTDVTGSGLSTDFDAIDLNISGELERSPDAPKYLTHLVLQHECGFV
jgi:hypothetical protein